MADHTITHAYDEGLPQVELTDSVHKDTVNPWFSQLINNDAFLRGTDIHVRTYLDGLSGRPTYAAFLADRAGTDIQPAVQAALDNAKTFLPARSTQPDNALGYDSGPPRVLLPDGLQFWGSTATVEVPHMVSLIGDGKRTCTITSDFDGQILRNKVESGVDPYTMRGTRWGGFRIKGNRTKTSQVGIDLLRPNESIFFDISVENCGSDGIKLREGIGNLFSSVDAKGNVGRGIYILEGVNNWGDLTSTNLPSNANVFDMCTSDYNDAECVHINNSNGNVFNGGVIQRGYVASGDNVGFNLKLDGVCQGNVLNGTWFEGAVQALAYIDDDVGNQTQPGAIFNSCRWTSGGAAGTVDRAVIVNKGLAIINDPHGQATPFKTISGSQAPFQINKANGGKIIYRGIPHTGRTASGNFVVEDENQNETAIQLFASQEIYLGTGVVRRYIRQELYSDRGQPIHRIFTDDAGGSWESEPRWQWVYDSLQVGTGSAAPDTFLKRNAAGVWEVDGSSQVVGQVQSTPSVTTAQLEDVGHAINTVAKWAGKWAFNSTTTRLLYSAGSTAGAVWKLPDGTTTHTPV